MLMKMIYLIILEIYVGNDYILNIIFVIFMDDLRTAGVVVAVIFRIATFFSSSIKYLIPLI